jgi:hypothetical protein
VYVLAVWAACRFFPAGPKSVSFVELFFCLKKLVERGKAKDLVYLAYVVLSVRGLVRGGRRISVEWHWGCGVGVAAERFTVVAAGGGRPLLVTAVSLLPVVSSFPLFFLRFLFSWIWVRLIGCLVPARPLCLAVPSASSPMTGMSSTSLLSRLCPVQPSPILPNKTDRCHFLIFLSCSFVCMNVYFLSCSTLDFC